LEFTFYFAAIVIGLLGSTHCLGMCGGIVGALDVNASKTERTGLARMSRHFTYNAGRIVSYSIAGAVAGFIGLLAADYSFGAAAIYGRLIAGLFMIALGLYLADWWRILTIVEKAGMHIWKRIQPLGQRFLPAKTPLQAFGLGLVWGWLPCGLVYSVLALAAATTSPLNGALIMFSFGLGTLPMLIAMGATATQMMKLVRHRIVRQVTGASIILIGIYICMSAFSGHGHVKHMKKAETYNSGLSKNIAIDGDLISR